MPSIVVEQSEGIAVFRIDRPPVNALDVDTLNELSDALDELRMGAARAVVLTGTGSIMSAGADLMKVLDGGDAYIDAGIDALTRCFRTLFEFPKPIVAAVNGHALAGGAVLTCGCDHRVMGESAGRIGVIELTAGVPFPGWALELVRYAVNNEHLHEVVAFARAYEPAEALAKGLVDELVSNEKVMDRALEAAAEDLMRFDDEEKAAWRSPEVHDAIKRQMEVLRRA